MASSDDGSGVGSAFVRTNLSADDGNTSPGSMGFQSVAGASVSAIATLCGPVRRSKYGASDVRHESAACWRSAGDIVICISFSASANVSGVTTGPVPLPVPNVGGAPAVVGVCELVVEGSLRRETAATSKPRGARIRNCRLVFIGQEAYYH